MKQRILVAAASLVLAALILLLLPLDSLPPNLGSQPTLSPDTGMNPTGTIPSTPPQQPGVVRFYSCQADVLEGLLELAEEYTALTGVEVEVITADAAGCQTTLQRLLESEMPPTIFCIHSQSQLVAWKDSLLDLKDTALAAALCNEGLGLRLEGKLLAVPTAVEGYGLLANSEILGAVLSRSEISDFSALSMWVKILKDNSIKTFPTAKFSVRDAWHLLMSEDLDRTRGFIDLYLANCTQTGDAMTLFAGGKTAFYLGGTWSYDDLAAMADGNFDLRNLDILPNYCEDAMQYICSAAWGIHGNAQPQDIDATLAFMAWLVTADGGPAPIDRLQTLAPFRDAAWYGNQLQKKMRGYMLSEAATLQWDGGGIGTDPLLMALMAYQEDRSDVNWYALCQVVEAMRTQYGYAS